MHMLQPNPVDDISTHALSVNLYCTKLATNLKGSQHCSQLGSSQSFSLIHLLNTVGFQRQGKRWGSSTALELQSTLWMIYQ